MEHSKKIPVTLIGKFEKCNGHFDGNAANQINLNGEVGTATVFYAVHDDDCSTYSIGLTDKRVHREYVTEAEEGREFEVDDKTWKTIKVWVEQLDKKYFD